MVDFHTHILPNIDDGSENVETSIKMLQSLYLQGATRVVLTPHFYMTRDDVKKFLKKRDAAEKELVRAVSSAENIPHAAIGAEVLLFPGLSGLDDLDKLCIRGTNYMLVEMPFDKWSNLTYDTLKRLGASGIRPIIAHVERYMKIQKDKNMIFRLLDMGCLIQANASFFTALGTKRKARKLLMSDCIHLIGSDCHNLKSRKPDVATAYGIIEKKLGEYGLESLEYAADAVLGNAEFII